MSRRPCSSTHPTRRVAPAEQLVSRTEEIVIDQPLAMVLAVVETTSLEDVIDRSTSLPGVSGTHVLTDGAFGAPGSRRLACLTDASTLVEQVLERTRTDKTYRFRYVVWNYTSPQARPIVYGVGRFLYTDLCGGRTHVTWTYAFQLATGFPVFSAASATTFSAPPFWIGSLPR